MANSTKPQEKSLKPRPDEPPWRGPKPLQFKRGTARAFRKVNPVLLDGEPAVELDTYRLKVGDGFTCWRKLPYISLGRKGDAGKSSYELWLESGGEGSIDDFLNFLIGEPGKSAYELWLELGNSGSVNDFINSLHGESAYEIWLDEGNEGSVSDFLHSFDGKSAYEIWLGLGNEGTEEDFLNSLKGASAYQVWLDEGNEGTEEEFIKAITGKDGKSIWDLYHENGGTMTYDEYMQWVLNPGIQWGTF